MLVTSDVGDFAAGAGDPVGCPLVWRGGFFWGAKRLTAVLPLARYWRISPSVIWRCCVVKSSMFCWESVSCPPDADEGVTVVVGNVTAASLSWTGVGAATGAFAWAEATTVPPSAVDVHFAGLV